jgi:hypothetical protein
LSGKASKKTGKFTHEVVYGVTSCTPEKANAEKVLKTNREHWSIENSCHYVIDWNYNEDRCRISKGYGPENITRLRRFAVGLIKSKGADCVAQKMRELTQNTRLVFDYLKITKILVLLVAYEGGGREQIYRAFIDLRFAWSLVLY